MRIKEMYFERVLFRPFDKVIFSLSSKRVAVSRTINAQFPRVWCVTAKSAKSHFQALSSRQ